MNDAQVLLLTVWSLLMMGAGYGFVVAKNTTTIKNDFFDFVLCVVVPLVALILASVSVVALIRLIALNL